MDDKTKICVPIFEKTIKNVLKSADKSIEAGADLLEFRIDALNHPDPRGVSTIIEDIDYSLIATNRRIQEGGLFNGSESERIDILLEAAKYADIVDIELGTRDEYLSEILKASKTSIISYHDYDKTPTEKLLLNIVKKEQRLGDIAKFAVMPKNISDTLVVLQVLSQVQNTIGISMGKIGSYTRIVAPIFGSPITFASVDSLSAPGQLDIRSTRDILALFGDNK